MKEIRFDRANRAAQHSRNFFVRELMIDAKNHRRALFAWQLRNRCPNLRRRFPFEQLDSRINSPLVEMRTRVDRFGRRSFDADAIQTHVHPDPIKPSTQGRLPAELLEPAIGANKHILREVARILVVGDEPITQLINRATMPFDDDVEGLTMARQTGRDERRFVELRKVRCISCLALPRLYYPHGPIRPDIFCEELANSGRHHMHSVPGGSEPYRVRPRATPKGYIRVWCLLVVLYDR